MRHDLRKTVLTMFGMAWGIATVVLLLAYGEGFGRAIQTIFESFGATAVGVFPGRTSQQAGGNKAGVQIRFTNDDVEMLRNVVPLVRHISRQSQLQSTVQNGNRSFSFPVYGTDATIRDIWNLDMESGRFLNDQDNLSHGLYTVIGSEAKDKLFSGIPPVGETIRMNGVSFQVVGVIKPRMQEGDNDENRSVYVGPVKHLHRLEAFVVGKSPVNGASKREGRGRALRSISCPADIAGAVTSNRADWAPGAESAGAVGCIRNHTPRTWIGKLV
jgi:putative ABC transport system permease protein